MAKAEIMVEGNGVIGAVPNLLWAVRVIRLIVATYIHMGLVHDSAEGFYMTYCFIVEVDKVI